MSNEKKKRDFGIPRAVGWKFLSQFTKYTAQSARAMVGPDQAPVEPETFEQVVERLGLTDNDIQKRKVTFLRLVALFSVLSLIAFGYAIYLFWEAHWLSGIIALSVVCVFLTQVFRYHFWYFQMKHRKLGCSIREWLKS